VTKTYRVLVADDHVRTRGVVTAALERSDEFTVCGEASDADGAIDLALREVPDICLLDINMPGNGIAAAARITALLPEVAIVMLTVSRQDSDLFDALRAGASGYLLKDLDDVQLVDNLKRVLRGEACLPGTLVVKLVEEFRDREYRKIQLEQGRQARLSKREWQVLELMRTGRRTLEIAEDLEISPSTVRSHVSSILRKLQVRNRKVVLERLDASRNDPTSSGTPLDELVALELSSLNPG
jgi:DNA-binding NarL/FixJ family response regulator